MRLKNLKDTQSYANKLAAWIVSISNQNGISIALEGDLGSGKTTLISAFVKSLDPKQKVSSPTYVLQHQYKISDALLIDHWDLYRVGAENVPDELFEPLEKGQIRFIEWASNSEIVSQKTDIRIEINIEDQEVRTIKLTSLNSEIEIPVELY